MRVIPLSQGKSTVIDDADYHIVKGFNWYAIKSRRTYYAQTHINTTDGRRSVMKMHRLILNTPPGLQTDHRNANGLDNRRCNLRICNHAENVRNRLPQKNNNSGFKGVSFFKAGCKWRADIGVDGERIFLGLFATRVEAWRAYKVAALKYHGEFVNLKTAESN